MVYAMEGSSDVLPVYGLLLQSAVAPLLYGLSILQIAISFEDSAEVKLRGDKRGASEGQRTSRRHPEVSLGAAVVTSFWSRGTKES